MITLQEQLKHAEEHYPSSRYTQMLRDKVANQQIGKSAQELYITGSVGTSLARKSDAKMLSNRRGGRPSKS